MATTENRKYGTEISTKPQGKIHNVEQKNFVKGSSKRRDSTQSHYKLHNCSFGRGEEKIGFTYFKIL